MRVACRGPEPDATPYAQCSRPAPVHTHTRAYSPHRCQEVCHAPDYGPEQPMSRGGGALHQLLLPGSEQGQPSAPLPGCCSDGWPPPVAPDKVLPTWVAPGI